MATSTRAVEETAVAWEDLTSAQQRFALEHEASIGNRGWNDERNVFVYRAGAALTRRWLIDRDGRVVETEVFPRRV